MPNSFGQGISVTNDDLRQHGLRRHLENKQAALFASFVSQAILKAPIAYAMTEDEDYDCVFWWKTGGRSGYARVQLKEIVPQDLNPSATIESELAKLSSIQHRGKLWSRFTSTRKGLLTSPQLLHQVPLSRRSGSTLPQRRINRGGFSTVIC